MTNTTAAKSYTGFQLQMMREVVEEHGTASEHTSFCCKVAANYEEILGSSSLKVDVRTAEEENRTHSGAGARQISRGNIARMASEKQIAFIRTLMNDRQVSEVERAAWTTMANNGMEMKQASSIIDRLLKRPAAAQATTSAPVGRPASDKQIDFVKKLLAQKVWPEDSVDFESLTSKTASVLIEQLLQAPAKPREPRVRETVEEGIYLYEGEYVKVQRALHGSGYLYTKAFDPEAQRWGRKGNLLGKLKAEHKLTEEQASAFGHLYGTCVRCAAPLTDEISIARGIGPICASKMGF